MAGYIPALALAVVPVAMAYLVFVKNFNKANLMYLLYARTPIGRMMHQSALKKHQHPKDGASKLSGPEWNVETDRALVRIVPFLSDNFAYILLCKNTKRAAVVDPADPQRVFEELKNLEKDLDTTIDVTSILTTHYHSDHAGGNTEFANLIGTRSGKKIEVIGGANERYPGVQGVTKLVHDNEEFQIGALTIKTLNVPCHTWGSVLFLCDKLCFTGDYLFSAGCGRFFEGGAADFVSSLENSVNDLGDDVLMFPGHEYTVSNLKFAQRVLPDDMNIETALEHATQKRAEGAPTIPSPFGVERMINVFLRAGDVRLVDKELVNRVRTLVEEAGEVIVASGADRQDKMTSRVMLSEQPDCIQLTRALRALKDKG